MATKSRSQQRIYKVDKFVVPESGRDEFIQKVQRTHELLRTLPGFLQDFVLEQSSGPGEFNIVTIVEWESPDSIEQAKPRVKAMHEENNFNPQEMFERLRIKVDLGNYRKINT